MLSNTKKVDLGNFVLRSLLAPLLPYCISAFSGVYPLGFPTPWQEAHAHFCTHWANVGEWIIKRHSNPSNKFISKWNLYWHTIGHPNRFCRQCGMQCFVFQNILRKLEEACLCPTRYVSSEEQLYSHLSTACTYRAEKCWASRLLSAKWRVYLKVSRLNIYYVSCWSTTIKHSTISWSHHWQTIL